MMHPAAALHQPKNRSLIEDDFRRLPEILARAERETAAGAATPDEGSAPDQTSSGDDRDDPPEPEQLRMF
jgi:DNA polymerase